VRIAVAAVPLVLVPLLGVVQGGYQPDAWVWSGAVAAWAAAVASVVSGFAGGLRRAWPWLAAAGALLAWTAASTLWSAHRSQTVLEVRRTVVYAAVVLALVMLARREASRFLVPATHIAVSGLIVYALARYLLEARRSDAFESYNLSEPLGYANAVGILATLGILLAVGIVAGAAPRGARIAAAGTVPLLTLALQLAESTASMLALGIGIAVIALVTPAVSRLLVALCAVAVPAAVAIWLGSFSELAKSVQTPRLSGHAVAPLALACAAAAAGIVAAVTLPAADRASRRTRRLVLAAVLVVALGGAAAVARTGAKEPRASYFHVAWHDEVRTHPLLGTGAGTFGHYWVASGKAEQIGGALDVHSLYLEALAELGPLGLVLVAALLLAPLRGVRRHRHAPYVPAALGAYTAFLVHAGLDWDWEMPAVVVAALCCAAAAGLAGLADERPLSSRARAAVVAAALALGGFAIGAGRSSTVPEAGPGNGEGPAVRGLRVQTRV
jgi:hypothetical protein